VKIGSCLEFCGSSVDGRKWNFLGSFVKVPAPSVHETPVHETPRQSPDCFGNEVTVPGLASANIPEDETYSAGQRQNVRNRASHASIDTACLAPVPEKQKEWEQMERWSCQFHGSFVDKSF
jgi:hypothetical protein